MTEKTPLVLVSGLLCTAALWRPQITALADVAEILVADHTGHDSISAIAASMLAAVPERFALAGLSMGGYIALEVMRQAPERVERLALLDTSARPDTPEQTTRRRDYIELSARGRFRGVSRTMLALFIHPDRLADAGLTATVLDMAEEVGQAAFVRQQTAIMGRPDSRPDLGGITCPTLVLCGRQDQLTPLALHEEMASAIPDATLVVIDDCGHLPTLERPGPVNEALRRWLLA